MADGFKVEVKGIKELQATLKALDIELKLVLSGAVSKGGDIVAQDAKRRVHVITGRLRDSIEEVNKVESGNRVESQVGSKVPYAEKEEFRVGGKYPGPHAYLRPALDENEAQIVIIIESAIAAALWSYK